MAMSACINGRIREQKLLNQICNSGQSEFLAVYGRRRVGKTFLIREFFESKIVFSVAGLANSGKTEQLQNFGYALNRYRGESIEKIKRISSWLEAFELLISYLESLEVKCKIIFLDELPWMDTPGSDFISSLEHFWNGWASARKDIVLIVCGSATSWMMDKLINNHGGLHNRITRKIHLKPFTLHETETFLENRLPGLSKYEIAECYMILGGIPYYLNLLQKGRSLAQNIDALLFNPDGELYDEFANLYASLFSSSEDYLKVVVALSKKGYGLTRNEISAETKIPSGSKLTKILSNLENCGFIRKYYAWGKAKNAGIYQLIDFFTLFYFRFIKKSTFNSLQYWSSIQGKPEFYSWAGYSFELLCLLHEEQIKNALGISGVLTSTFSWRSEDYEPGAQIDMVLLRNDNTINLCEMKFCEGEFKIDKAYEMNLRNKMTAFRMETKCRQSLQLTLVTTFGLKENEHSGVVSNQVRMEDLFD